MRERSRGSRRQHSMRDYELNNRCTAQAIQSSGMYRCVLEARDGHTEHQYNYFRSLTKREKAEWFSEGESQIEKDE